MKLPFLQISARRICLLLNPPDSHANGIYASLVRMDVDGHVGGPESEVIGPVALIFRYRPAIVPTEILIMNSQETPVALELEVYEVITGIPSQIVRQR